MSLPVHQISPKSLPLESRNSHIVHVLPRQLISKPILLSILSILLKTIRQIVAAQIVAAQIVAANCLFTVIRPTPFDSISWII